MSDRRLSPGESRPCFVGSGECLINAAYEIDDGSGGREYICIPHKIEFERMEKMIASMSPEQVSRFKAAVDEAHKSK